MIGFSLLALLLGSFLLCGCSGKTPAAPDLKAIDTSGLPEPDLVLNIPGFCPCTTNPDTSIQINSNQPLIILVHGCEGSAGRFRALAQVFAFHGQQAICFYYNDRDNLITSSQRLIEALETISGKMKNRQITVIGHSLGGLILRKALVSDRKNFFQSDNVSIRLVTISAPFSGIDSAAHCASITARILTLGLSVPICKLISGDKWYQITSPSPFIQQPGELVQQVDEHLLIITDETGSCRTYNDKGECVEDDFVFTVQEQTLQKAYPSPTVSNIKISAGHVEIVGDYRTPPKKLIVLLQARGIMNKTQVGMQKQFSILLSQLYN